MVHDRAITPFAVMCGQKTIRFKRWMACNMAWPPAQRIHAIEQMAQGQKGQTVDGAIS